MMYATEKITCIESKCGKTLKTGELGRWLHGSSNNLAIKLKII